MNEFWHSEVYEAMSGVAADWKKAEVEHTGFGSNWINVKREKF